MLVNEFDYRLPETLIAQTPVEPRDHSRLLVLDRARLTRSDHYFYEVAGFLNPGDLLIFNDTRVIPARLYARKNTADGARLEIFLLKRLNSTDWECLARPGKRVQPGVKLLFGQNVVGEAVAVTPGGERVIRFPAGLDFRRWLAQNGETPLPPYITQKLADPERYQTVYAKQEGSVAAPTAGLHFTPELMRQLTERGVQTGFLTLHVGLGTFRPVQTERLEDHLMHSEAFSLAPELAERIAATKAAGKRVIAVGTTVVRVLESQAQGPGVARPGSGTTDIFIYPGYSFKIIDGLITNFHLPKSTLLMLVAAFAGREFVLDCYNYAVEQGYRFFSFGDAMLIV
ncbi:MAG: tRNA preQ1(34) S-adenosylmethionine ribosyltransferase-isomerase QueA [Bacillota bacterium]|jgi:S-adenosylmethionine:tRNA ribosyltransferase-isomerase